MAARGSFCRVLTAVIALAVCSPAVSAAEPSKQFLDALRQRGYLDMAIEYLRQADTNPRIDQRWKRTIDYEMGVTLIYSSRKIGDRDRKFAQLDEAAARIKKFTEANPNHELVGEANAQLANALVERGRALALAADSRSTPKEKKGDLRQTARGFYEEAEKLFNSSEKTYRATLKEKFPRGTNVKEGTKAWDQRNAIRGKVVEAQMLAALVVFDTAATAKKGSEAHKTILNKAAGLFNKMATNYRTRLAGHYGRMYEARCYQDLGDHKKAVTTFNLVLTQPEQPAFRALKGKTIPFAMESFTAEKQFKEGIAAGEKYLKFSGTKATRNREYRKPESLAVRYHVLRLYMALIAQHKEKPDPKISTHRAMALKHAKFGETYPSKHQAQFRKMRAELRGQDVKIDETEKPETFLAAYERGTKAKNDWQDAKMAIPKAEKNNPDKVAELKQQRDEGKAKAFKMFNKALSLVTKEDNENSLRQVNMARYYLCYLYWDSEDIWSAAVVSEFLADNYPDAAGARSAAKIAMACYQKMYTAASVEDRQFEFTHVKKAAQRIIETWPDSKEATSAFTLLVDFLVREHQLAEAKSFVEKIPSTSPKRAAAEIKVGQAYWKRYLTQRAKKKDDPTRPAQEKLDMMVSEAKALLQAAVEHLQTSSAVTQTMAYASRSLAQIYLDTDEPSKATEMLENEKLGALTLIAAKHEAVASPAFVESAYKVALRAYVTAEPPQFEKAKEVLNLLNELVKQDDQAAQKLTKILIGIAVDLYEQMKSIDEKGGAEGRARKETVTNGFKFFLEQVSKREGSSVSLPVRNWMFSTYYNLAEGLKTDDGELSEQAKELYESALAQGEKILEKSDDYKMKPDAVMSVKLRLAKCSKGMSDYEKAVDYYAQILTQKSRILNIQIQAAQLYQEWGDQGGDANNYLIAIKGAKRNAKTRKNVVWGWQHLSKMAGRYFEHEKRGKYYTGVYHQARYNFAYCVYKYGMRQEEGAKRESYAKKAENAIRLTHLVRPDLGGEDWRPKYDELLKDIQEGLGKPRAGLEAFKDK